MPAQRPCASFDPIHPSLDLAALVEETPNFEYVPRIPCDMIEEQGLAAFDKLVLLHVVIGGKPLVVDGFHHRLDQWTFSTQWLRDNLGQKYENARDLTKKENLTLSVGHYLKNMPALTNQWNDHNHRDPGRQRIYLKDIDCPPLWHEKVKEHIPPGVFYLNDSTGDTGGPGSVDEPGQSLGGRKGRGVARAGDLMSCLPPAMRADNLMCYIGHEGTYTPAHREMCASLGQNIMVETSGAVDEGGIPTKPGSSIWFMTETKDRHLVSEYWLSTLGHDIEIEKHYAQINAWKAAPFTTYIVEQKVGDFILIPPLAPHQVWNRGTRTMKVAWNRTTVETLEMALNEALPRARMVCRDEQYKNKAIILFSLQKYSQLLDRVDQQKKAMVDKAERHALKFGPKVRQLQKDFKRLHTLYTRILLSEMFGSDAPAEKHRQYLPYDSNVTCSYCRCNIFNRFLTCTLCVIENPNGENDTYDICLECYSMGRSCRCISKLTWVEQFPWVDLVEKHELWRHQIINFEEGVNDNSPQVLNVERQRMTKKTLAQVCQEQLKARPFHDPKKEFQEEVFDDEPTDDEVLNADDTPRKKRKVRRSAKWLKEHLYCHICRKREPTWKLAICNCGLVYCYGSLWRAFDTMPQSVMEDPKWKCPRCRKVCSCAGCRNDSKMRPFKPTGTILGHDTRHVADPRSVESLVDFSHSNIGWVQKASNSYPHETRILQRRQAEAKRAKNKEPALDHNYVDEEIPGQRSQRTEKHHHETDLEVPDSQKWNGSFPIDPQLTMLNLAATDGQHGSSDGGYESTSSKEPNSREEQESINPSSPQARRRMKKAAAQALRAMDTLSQLERNPGDFIMQAGLGNVSETGDDNRHQTIAPTALMINRSRHTTVAANGITYEYPDPTLPQYIPAPLSQEAQLLATAEIAETQISYDGNSKKRKRVSFHTEAVNSPSVADSKANARFKNAQIQARLQEAHKNDRSISVNAALTGKSLLLKLPVHSSSLARLNGDSSRDRTSNQEGDAVEDNSDRILLKSDFNVKHSGNHKASPKPRKKIIQQIEKDDDFSTRKPQNRSNTNGVSTVRIEKVVYNEASDDTDDGEALLEASLQTRVNGSSTKERRLPKYLAGRNEAEGVAAPAELPSRSGRKPRTSNGDPIFRFGPKKSQTRSGEQLLNVGNPETLLASTQPAEPITQSTQATSVTLPRDPTPSSNAIPQLVVEDSMDRATNLPNAAGPSDLQKENEQLQSPLDTAITAPIEAGTGEVQHEIKETPQASAEIRETPPAPQTTKQHAENPVEQPGKRGRPEKSLVQIDGSEMDTSRILDSPLPSTSTRQDILDRTNNVTTPSFPSKSDKLRDRLSNGLSKKQGVSINSTPKVVSTDLPNSTPSASEEPSTQTSTGTFGTFETQSRFKATPLVATTKPAPPPRRTSSIVKQSSPPMSSAEANRLAKMRAWADTDSLSSESEAPSDSDSDSESVIPAKRAKTAVAPKAVDRQCKDKSASPPKSPSAAPTSLSANAPLGSGRRPMKKSLPSSKLGTIKKKILITSLTGLDSRSLANFGVARKSAPSAPR